MKGIIRKHPIVAYFIMTFGWTWMVVAIMLLSGQTDVNNPSPVFIFGGIVCNVSPSISAYIVARIAEGKKGVNRLKQGFTKRVSLKYVLMALLTVPVITILTALISSHTFREYQFQVTVPLIFMGMIWPFFSGFGEEFGWRGFILPRLIERFGLLKAALLLGFIWEVWHIPMHYMAFKNYEEYMLPTFLTTGFLNLILQTVIMSYIFVKSQGSILLMILYHYTITASSIFLGAFFQIESAPKLGVMESLISISLFVIYAVFLYSRKDKLERNNALC